MIGQKIGDRYQLERLIGQGAMGAVYEARHVDTKRRVAVKLITDEASKNTQLVARFEREAQATAKILTPHIVEILDTGRDKASGHPFIVMELLEGENVEQLAARIGPLDPELVARIGAQACKGLQKAHQAGVVHRDVKPANLFLARTGDGQRVLKLLDFGVAKLKMDHASETGNESLTRTGSVIGSPMYMSPEQARGLKSIDHRTDIWSLGMVLYELLLGKPLHHDATGLGDLIIAICAEEPPPIRDRVPAVAAALSDAVRGALRLSVDDRYADAAAMLKALESWLPAGSHITEEMLSAQPSPNRAGADALAAVGGSVAMDATGDDPTQASALHRGSGRRAPPSPSAVRVEVAKDGPTVSSPIEDLILSAGVPADANGANAPGPSGDSGLFGPTSEAAGAERDEDPAPAAAGSAPSNGSSLARGLGAVVAGLVVGLAVTFLVNLALPVDRADGASGQSSPPADDVRAAPATTAAPETTAAGAETTTEATTAEPVALTASVKVTPPFGAVAVDGKRVEIREGAIEIQGAEDSQHDVVLTVGGRSVTTRVRLTAAGPKPAEIIFPGAGGPVPPAGPRPKGKGKMPDIYE